MTAQCTIRTYRYLLLGLPMSNEVLGQIYAEIQKILKGSQIFKHHSICKQSPDTDKHFCDQKIGGTQRMASRVTYGPLATG